MLKELIYDPNFLLNSNIYSTDFYANRPLYGEMETLINLASLWHAKKHEVIYVT